MKTIYIVCAEYGNLNGPKHMDIVRAFTTEASAKKYAEDLRTLRVVGSIEFDYFETYVDDIKLEEG